MQFEAKYSSKDLARLIEADLEGQGFTLDQDSEPVFDLVSGTFNVHFVNKVVNNASQSQAAAEQRIATGQWVGQIRQRKWHDCGPTELPYSQQIEKIAAIAATVTGQVEDSQPSSSLFEVVVPAKATKNEKPHRRRGGRKVGQLATTIEQDQAQLTSLSEELADVLPHTFERKFLRMQSTEIQAKVVEYRLVADRLKKKLERQTQAQAQAQPIAVAAGVVATATATESEADDVTTPSANPQVEVEVEGGEVAPESIGERPVVVVVVQDQPLLPEPEAEEPTSGLETEEEEEEKKEVVAATETFFQE